MSESERGEFGMPMIGSPFIDPMKEKDAGAFDVPLEYDAPDFDGESDLASWERLAGRVPNMPNYMLRVTEDGIMVDYGEQGYNVDAVTPEAKYILAKVLPTMLKDFLESNAKYARAQTGHDLGLKGVIPDINRKFGVLVSRIWFGEQDAGRDPTDEIIDDLIGHLLLMRGKMGVSDES